MVKVLFISQHFPPDQSGNASRIYDMSKYLVKLGCEVTVISPFPSFPHGTFKQKWKLYESKNVSGIIHIQIFSWNPSKNDPSFLQRAAYYLLFPLHSLLWAMFYTKEYDIIISTSPPIFTGIPGVIIKKIVKKPFVYDVRDLWIEAAEGLGFTAKNSFLANISRKYEKYLFKQSDLITVTTHQIKHQILEENGINESTIHVIPNGVDTEKFGLSIEKKPRIIYAGNIGYAQDLKIVIKAVQKVNETIPLTFLLIGDGDSRKYLEKYVDTNKLKDIIIFTNKIERESIPALLSECLLGVAPLKDHPSLRYALPTKIYEYMAAGIPFLGTGKGEIEALAKNSKAGVIAENTVESIQYHIESLLKDKKTLEEMGKKGKIYAKMYADRKEITKNLFELLKGLT